MKTLTSNAVTKTFSGDYQALQKFIWQSRQQYGFEKRTHFLGDDLNGDLFEETDNEVTIKISSDFFIQIQNYF